VKIKGAEEDQYLINQLDASQPVDRPRSTSSPVARRNISTSLNALPQIISQSGEGEYPVALSLQDSDISSLTRPLTQQIEIESEDEQKYSSASKLVVQFDEELVQYIIGMGYTRTQVLIALVEMSENRQDITLESAIERVVSSEAKSKQEATLRKQLQETEAKLKELLDTLKTKEVAEEKKQEELVELKAQIEQLGRVRKEKDTQIEILTGGFGFHNYLKVHSGVDIIEETECIICMDAPKNYRTSCGCKVMCDGCYKKLKKKECSFCGKKIK